MERFGPGVKLYGFCNGYFGRDSYGEKLIVASGTWNGENYIVAKEESNTGLSFASGFDLETAEEWLSEPEIEW